MKNWRTSLGGSIQSLGTTLMGAGIVPSLTSLESAENLKWLVIAGFVLKAIGEQVTALFSADACIMKQQVKEAVELHTGNTNFLKKPQE